jgi:hypothetical protein
MRRWISAAVAAVAAAVAVSGCGGAPPAVDGDPGTLRVEQSVVEPAPRAHSSQVETVPPWPGSRPVSRAQPVEASPRPAPPAAATSGQSHPSGNQSGPTLRHFTAQQFVDLFYQVNLPGMSPITAPPPITPDAGADERIRSIAEGRGYRLQSQATGSLGTVDGRPVQPPVATAWRDLAAAASADGITIAVTSAYRSVDHQRTIFLTRLGNAMGADPLDLLDEIAAGDFDDEINSVLRTSSIPGYSKHHTGYAVDVWDVQAGLPITRFGETAAYAWMSADNFANAKRFGFIPSYPHGVAQQGPMPEEWEFVWVGTGPLHH